MSVSIVYGVRQCYVLRLKSATSCGTLLCNISLLYTSFTCLQNVASSTVQQIHGQNKVHITIWYWYWHLNIYLFSIFLVMVIIVTTPWGGSRSAEPRDFDAVVTDASTPSVPRTPLCSKAFLVQSPNLISLQLPRFLIEKIERSRWLNSKII